MYRLMKKSIFSLLLAASVSANAQQTDVTVNTGAFGNDWESLSAWECPEWFKATEAKCEYVILHRSPSLNQSRCVSVRGFY